MAYAIARTERLPIPIINTTPLIDVMLVLLVMFLIALPTQKHATMRDLPGTDGAPAITQPTVRNIQIDFLGGIWLDDQPVSIGELSKALAIAPTMRNATEIHVRTDGLAPYTTFDHVMAVIKTSGYDKVGLVGNERFAGD
jgi:biopolymer transport protein ExbD